MRWVRATERECGNHLWFNVALVMTMEVSLIKGGTVITFQDGSEEFVSETPDQILGPGCWQIAG